MSPHYLVKNNKSDSRPHTQTHQSAHVKATHLLLVRLL